jgi:hypothetical protein
VRKCTGNENLPVLDLGSTDISSKENQPPVLLGSTSAELEAIFSSDSAFEEVHVATPCTQSREIAPNKSLNRALVSFHYLYILHLVPTHCSESPTFELFFILTQPFSIASYGGFTFIFYVHKAVKLHQIKVAQLLPRWFRIQHR